MTDPNLFILHGGVKNNFTLNFLLRVEGGVQRGRVARAGGEGEAPRDIVRCWEKQRLANQQVSRVSHGGP